MTSINKTIILGNVGKDPEVRSFQDGGKVVSFSIATSERWKDKNTGEKREKTEWHNVVAFGPLAEIVETYVAKGTRVYVEGKLQTRKWQDKDGKDRWSTEVVLQGYGAQLVLLGGKDGGSVEREPEDARSFALDDDIPF